MYLLVAMAEEEGRELVRAEGVVQYPLSWVGTEAVQEVALENR